MKNVIEFTVYNPGSLSDEDFLKGFVARQNTANALIEQLVKVVTGDLQTHFLISGQRGMGKTSMLRKLAMAVQNDTRLKTSLIPLSFREEQYNVHSSQVFWTNCLDALGDWFDRIGEHEKAAQLDKEITSLNSTHDDALALFNTWISRENRRPLLLLDNIDLIFTGLKKEQNYLNKFLPQRNGMVIVGGSATSVDTLFDPAPELCKAFQLVHLDRLSKAELIACLRSLALVNNNGTTVLQVLEKEPARIKTLHDLTGGNPRTLTMLYMILERNAGHDVFEDLERLLDQVTVLYKAKIEDLPPQARVVLDAVALAWDPTLATTVATTTLLEVTTVSSQLDRLQKEGIIEKVPVSKTTKSAYQISERFFNIWYLMRHGARRQKNRLRWLTVFLRGFYSHAQLVERAKSLVNCDGELGIETGQYLLALSNAIDDPGWRSVLKSQARDELERYALSLGLKLSEIVDPSDVPLPANAMEWVRHGNLLREQLKRPAEAEAAFLKAISLESNNWSGWYNLGSVRLRELANSDGAIEAFKKALLIRSRDLPTQYMLANAFSLAGRVEAAKTGYRTCLKLNNKFYLAEIALGDIYSEEGNLAKAAKHYQLAGSLAPKFDTEALHASGFFAAFILEEFERGLKIYQRLLDIDPKDIPALSNEAVINLFIPSTDKQHKPLDEELLLKHSKGGQALMRALEAISRNDLSAVLHLIETIFADSSEQIFDKYKGFTLLLFREAARKGWGELLLQTLDRTGVSDKNWPLRAGYNAYIFGEEQLLDVNPEVRSAASKIMGFLSAPDLYKNSTK